MKDYLSGLFMLLEDQYGVGDVVDFGTVIGTVEAVALRVTKVRDALDRLRAQERAIMQLCVRDARMPRADFLRLFPGNEIDMDWAANLAKGYDLDQSVERAKAYISGALAAMLDLGRGSGPMNHMFDLKGGFAE